MDKELKQRASESADRMTRAGMTLSAGILHELLAEGERLGDENAAQADYIQFLEMELMRAHVAGLQAPGANVPEQAQELGEEKPQGRELRLREMAPAGEMHS